ncbi:hypothetical protein [Enterobacter cancerogenus]|uniref:hypothetical protein n=1 Tax=Enterobacter cancerogenus TaxID=69218 RepID=UPI000537A61B|nr:hypothetical protein [Enterobacter cancerogenus]KGT90765.1 hypothetical protein NH00_10410 [Enterobacter cancerogenus]
MNIQTIKGTYTTIGNKKTTNKVIYLPFNNSHLDIALILAESSTFDSYIYVENFDIKAREYLRQNPETKIKFILDRDSVAGLLPNMSKVVVFLGYVVPFIPFHINEIVATCLKVKLPIYEVPHGMFQTGINITDDSKLISTRSHYYGFGQTLPSISNIKLYWFGENGFGYPRTVKFENYKERQLPNFTLITSNTNWYLYSPKDKRKFYTEVFNYARENPSEIFIWCAHPAEFSENAYSSNALNLRPENIYLYGLDKDIYFHGLEGTDDLIPYCEYGISTVTTCLLEFEIHKKRVNVFTCPGVEKLISEIEEKHVFSNRQEIKKSASYLKTGFLKNFDPELYDQQLSNDHIIDENNNHNYLSSFLPKNINI